MKKARHTTPQIIEKLRQADVALGKVKKVPEICGPGFPIQVSLEPLQTCFAFGCSRCAPAVASAMNASHGLFSRLRDGQQQRDKNAEMSLTTRSSTRVRPRPRNRPRLQLPLLADRIESGRLLPDSRWEFPVWRILIGLNRGNNRIRLRAEDPPPNTETTGPRVR